jgi:signal transduction histidine kinase
MRMSLRSGEAPHLDKKRTVLLLRSVVIFTTCYLLLFSEHGVSAGNLAYVGILVASNLALGFAPRRVFGAAQFAPCLLLGDTALVVVGLYQTVGFSQEFLIVYFFTIFLTTTAETLAQIAIGATLVSGLYGYWLWVTTGGQLEPSHWLRLPFFFVVAIFYAFLTDELKVEKRRRQEAEREREHLRLLLRVSNTASQVAVTDEFLKGIGNFVELALPHLHCEVGTEAGPVPIEEAEVWLPIEAYGERFGHVRLHSEHAQVTDNERALCELVIHAVASAAYTARQVDVAQQASRLKEEFIATLSHELRTPLHAILGYTDLIESVVEPAADPLVMESVDRLRANARRLHGLLEEMLGFAALRAGHASAYIAPIQIQSIVGELAGLTRDLLAGRPIEFELEMPPEIPPILTDGHKLRQVLASLLSNAAKFTERGQVKLSVAVRSTNHILISVSDTGIGIAPEDLTHIFEDFRQLDGSSTRRFGGVGLGLALARGTLAMLGGTLEVTSRPQEGSTFRVILPVGVPANGDAAGRGATRALSVGETETQGVADERQWAAA